MNKVKKILKNLTNEDTTGNMKVVVKRDIILRTDKTIRTTQMSYDAGPVIPGQTLLVEYNRGKTPACFKSLELSNNQATLIMAPLVFTELKLYKTFLKEVPIHFELIETIQVFEEEIRVKNPRCVYESE